MNKEKKDENNDLEKNEGIESAEENDEIDGKTKLSTEVKEEKIEDVGNNEIDAKTKLSTEVKKEKTQDVEKNDLLVTSENNKKTRNSDEVGSDSVAKIVEFKKIDQQRASCDNDYESVRKWWSKKKQLTEPEEICKDIIEQTLDSAHHFVEKPAKRSSGTIDVRKYGFAETEKKDEATNKKHVIESEEICREIIGTALDSVNKFVEQPATRKSGVIDVRNQDIPKKVEEHPTPGTKYTDYNVNLVTLGKTYGKSDEEPKPKEKRFSWVKERTSWLSHKNLCWLELFNKLSKKKETNISSVNDILDELLDSVAFLQDRPVCKKKAQLNLLYDGSSPCDV